MHSNQRCSTGTYGIVQNYIVLIHSHNSQPQHTHTVTNYTAKQPSPQQAHTNTAATHHARSRICPSLPVTSFSCFSNSCFSLFKFFTYCFDCSANHCVCKTVRCVQLLLHIYIYGFRVLGYSLYIYTHTFACKQNPAGQLKQKCACPY